MMPSMIFDSWTMAVKEWREWRFVRSRFGWGFLVILIMAWSLIASLLLGYLEAGPLIIPIVWAALPFVLSAVMITDSIAGERERQTLETLLASRLPDRAFVLGKIIAVTLFGWGLLLLGMVPGLLQQAWAQVGVFADGHPLAVVGWLVSVSAPSLVLVVLAGALISLYTPSARFAFLLSIAFAGAVALGATGLAVWWVAQGGGNPESLTTLLAVLALSVTLVDGCLLGWLLLSVHRDRLLAIG